MFKHRFICGIVITPPPNVTLINCKYFGTSAMLAVAPARADQVTALVSLNDNALAWNDYSNDLPHMCICMCISLFKCIYVYEFILTFPPLKGS